jgi:hypothetical protein
MEFAPDELAGLDVFPEAAKVVPKALPLMPPGFVWHRSLNKLEILVDAKTEGIVPCF